MATAKEALIGDVKLAARALAKSVTSIVSSDDPADVPGALAETFRQYKNYLRKLIPAAVEKKKTGDEFPGEPGCRGHGLRDDPKAFLASGHGPMHDQLFRSYDNLRRSGGAYANQTAFARAWAGLSDDEKQQIRNEEAAAAAAREAEEAKRKAAAEMEKQQMHKNQLIDVAKRVIDGRDVGTSREELYAAARKVAIADRQEGETIEKAVARFWQSPAARDIYQAIQVAKVGDVAADRSGVVVKLGSAMLALHKRADEIRSGTSMTRQQAVAKIAVTPAEARIWNAAKSEQLEQV